MKIIDGGEFTGERALFNSSNLEIRNARFHSGESPLKESEKIELFSSEFCWKYPLWYCKDIIAVETALRETARSGIWYTKGIKMTDCLIEAPKTFRRSSRVFLTRVDMPKADETMWNCDTVHLEDVRIRGDYFGFGCSNVFADGIEVDGNYLFDGGKNITVKNSRLISKDAFWNCENVLVENCYIAGEYLGWNSKNITFINCTIESNQGMCYMQNVVMRDCKLIKTDLCFEYCTVDAEINSHIDSVKNPISGRIVAESIGEIIHEADKVDTSKTEIIEVKKCTTLTN